MIYQIQQIFANFLWGDSQFGRRFHWVAWAKMCCPTDVGGLGTARDLSNVGGGLSSYRGGSKHSFLGLVDVGRI